MKRSYASFLFAIALLTGCGANGAQSTAPQSPILPVSNAHTPNHRPLDTLGGGPVKAVINILFGDAAPQLGGKTLAHLYIGVDEVDVTNSSGQTAAVASYSTPQIVDVLQYQGTTGANIANSSTTSVSYEGATFILDVASSQAVFTDGSSLPLGYLINAYPQSTSGADQNMSTQAIGYGTVAVSSYVPFTIPSGGTQSVRADFNAFESLRMRNGNLIANPVIFTAPVAGSGQINGTVTNRWGNPVSGAVVVAYQNGTAANTAYTGADGSFQLTTLSTGSYQLVVYNQYTNAAGRYYASSGATNSASAVGGPTVSLGAGQTANAGSLSD